MKVLVIPDVHLKPELFDIADNVDSTKYDNIVCLGDLVDDWGCEYDENKYAVTLERVLEFDENHPDMLWCWGNHDLCYAYCFPEPWFQLRMMSLVSDYIVKMEKQFGFRYKVIHKIDDTLFSHAGLSYEYVCSLYKDVPDLDQVLRKINYMPKEITHAKKLWSNDSPLWLRPPNDMDMIILPFLYGQDCSSFGIQSDDILWQVVGHTPVKEPTEICGMLILDTFSLRPDCTPVGNQKLVIVDTMQHTWAYADV